MARFRATPMSDDQHHPELISVSVAGPARVLADGYAVVPLPPADIDPERAEVMRRRRVVVRRKTVTGAVKDQAIAWWGRTRQRSEASDRDGVSAVTRLLLFVMYETGVVDVRRAAHRRVIDRYLTLERENGVRRTFRWQLYLAGRVFYPQEFPDEFALHAPRADKALAATNDEVEAWRRLAPTLPPRWSRALHLVIDASRHAGARSAELMVLRRNDIQSVTVDGRIHAVVSLGAPGDGKRLVPVLNEHASARLLEIAECHPFEYLLAVDDGKPERNAVNRINSRLDERHLPHRVSCEGMRQLWLAEAARQWPMAVFAQLAGTDRIEGVKSFTGGPQGPYTIPALITGAVEINGLLGRLRDA
jgi:hypothetical protein